jgi:sarcosine oxidase subunit gamma
VRECTGLSLASLVARRDQVRAVAEAAQAAFGVPLPLLARATGNEHITFVWAGPGHWLVETVDRGADIEAFLAPAFGPLAAICDQSDSRVILELAGAAVRDVLAKGVPLDLHPRVFGVGDVALTAAHHVGLHLRQVSAEPRYRISVVRSYFGSFWHWLESSAAEFGCEVLPPLHAS